MSEQIYINDLLIEMPDKPVVALTSQINDLAELKDHQSTLSYTIKAPATINNLKVIENAERIESDTVIPYRKNRARVVKNGVDVVKNGFAEIRSIDKTINFVVYEGNVDFFAAIEGKTLYDLDLSALNHGFDLDTVINLNPVTGGVKYPLINYGTYVNNARTVDCKDLRPAIFAFTILNKIIEDSGFTAEGSILSNTKWQKIIIPFINGFNKELFYNKSPYPIIFDGESAVGATFPTSFIVGQGDNNHNPPYPQYSLSGGMYLRYKITDCSPGAGGISISINGTTYLTSPTHDGIGSFYTDSISEIGLAASVGVKLTYVNCTVEILGGRFYGTLTPDDVSVLEGDFSVYFPPTTKSNLSGSSDVWLAMEAEANEDHFETRAMQNFLPDMTQKEFVKWFGQMFHVLFKTSYHDKKLILKTFTEIVNDTSNAINWTNNLHSRDWQLEYRIGSYSRNNTFKYKEDSEDKAIDFGLGDGSIKIDDSTLAVESEIFNSPFAATAMGLYLEDLDVAFINKLDENNEFKVKTEPRILIDDVSTLDDDVTYDNGVESEITDTDIPVPYFIRLDKDFNLGFNNSILIDNYSAFTTVLNKSKKLIAPFKLTAVDFHNLDHFIPVYLAQHSAYFYINKVIGFTGEGLTKVELIRIGERNNALIVPTRRCTLLESAEYKFINGMWPAGDHIFTLESLTINGLSYTAGQTLTVNAPSGLLVGLGLDDVTNYITNISDWINSILPDDFQAHDDLTTIDHPEGSTFEFEISYEDVGNGMTWTSYKYNNLGFYLPGAADPVATFICETL